MTQEINDMIIFTRKNHPVCSTYNGNTNGITRGYVADENRF